MIYKEGMNKIYLLAFAFFLGCAHSKPAAPCPKFEVVTKEAEGSKIVWRHFNSAAIAEARAKNRIMILHFGANNASSKEMDKTTFDDPRVAKVLNEKFIPILLTDGKEVIADKLKLTHDWPQTAIVLPDGQAVIAVGGYIAPDAYLGLLNKLLEAVDEAGKDTDPPPADIKNL